LNFFALDNPNVIRRPLANPANYTFLETRIICVHFRRRLCAYIFIRFCGWLRKRPGRSRSSKVVDIDTNDKRTCDFLLVFHSNIGHNLLFFQRYCRFSAQKLTYPILPEFCGCSHGTRSPTLGSIRTGTLSLGQYLRLSNIDLSLRFRLLILVLAQL